MAEKRGLVQRASDAVLFLNVQSALYMLEPWERVLALSVATGVAAMSIYTAVVYLPPWFA
jgi:hypothetical protein